MLVRSRAKAGKGHHTGVEGDTRGCWIRLGMTSFGSKSAGFARFWAGCIAWLADPCPQVKYTIIRESACGHALGKFAKVGGDGYPYGVARQNPGLACLGTKGGKLPWDPTGCKACGEERRPCYFRVSGRSRGSRKLTLREGSPGLSCLGGFTAMTAGRGRALRGCARSSPCFSWRNEEHQKQRVTMLQRTPTSQVRAAVLAYLASFYSGRRNNSCFRSVLNKEVQDRTSRAESRSKTPSFSGGPRAGAVPRGGGGGVRCQRFVHGVEEGCPGSHAWFAYPG